MMPIEPLISLAAAPQNQVKHQLKFNYIVSLDLGALENIDLERIDESQLL
jgi:hypothetical protein